MYHNNHSNPYANQYPPPPPLLPEDQHLNSHTTAGYTPPVSHSNNSYDHTDQGYVTNISGTQRDSISMVGYNDNRSLGYSTPQQQQPSTYNTHGDPTALTPSEYHQIELEEQKYNHQQKLLQQQQLQQQQQQYNNNSNNGYEIDYRDEHDTASPYTPMVQPVPPKELENGYYIDHDRHDNNKKNKNNNKNNNNNYARGGGAVTYAPADEAKYYQPYQRDDRRGGGCNCCCYNPAMTCCSCFCMLISIGFLAAGIALIIASKVIGENCNNKCGEAVDKVSAYTDANPCDSICNKVVHDGMFYGGIAVAALAGISVVWRLFMWMCAAGSRR
ncbi:unnamed protein product [Cunninghamella blakesleeana]